MPKTSFNVDFRVHLGPATSELLKTETTLYGDGYTTTLKNGATRSFKNVPADPSTTLKLKIAVPSAPNNVLTPDLAFEQEFEIAADLSLVPVKSGFSGLATAAYPLHPRIDILNAKPPYSLGVDLLFINVILSLDPRKYDSYKEPIATVEGRSEFAFLPKAGGEARMIHHGCRMQIYQMTQAEPACWAAVIPPNIPPDVREFNVLVFFQPTMLREKGYARASDCPFNEATNLPRYTRDPAVWAPYYWARQADGGARWVQAPHTGFEGQLAASGRPVILVMPYPKGEQGAYSEASGIHLPSIIESLLRALWNDTEIGLKEKRSVTLKRLGLAGFSAGGAAATVAWNNLHTVESRLKELYLFDPVALPDKKKLKIWLDRGKENRVCLVGGKFYSTLADYAADLPQTRIFPPSADYFTKTGTPWEAALFALDQALKPVTLALTVPGGAPQLLSLLSKVSISNLSPLTLRADTPAKALEKPMKISPIEAAALVRAWQIKKNSINPNAQSIRNPKDFKELTDLEEIIFKMRHEWAAGGGFGNPARYPYGVADSAVVGSEFFFGHLHACLKDSNFR